MFVKKVKIEAGVLVAVVCDKDKSRGRVKPTIRVQAGNFRVKASGTVINPRKIPASKPGSAVRDIEDRNKLLSGDRWTGRRAV